MYDFPYTSSYEKLEGLFEAIINSEVPDKFTYRYLAEIGFASSKDRDMLPVLKKLGLVDSKGRPTQLYRALRDPGAYKDSLTKAIENGYVALFKEYPNSINVSENVLTGYFRKLTEASHEESVVYLRTFSELIKLADYRERVDQGIFQEAGVGVNLKEKNKVGNNIGNISLNINLPTTTDEKVYEALFKHLKDLLAR